MRKVACAFGLVLAMSATAAAQKAPKADIFLGYSYVRVPITGFAQTHINLNGGSLSIAYNVNRFLGIVGDIGIYRGGFGDARGNAVSYLFGPRLSYRARGRITPYAQVLFGGAHISAVPIRATSRNAFAMTAGGGVDANLTKNLGLRLLQVEYFLTKFQEESGASFLPTLGPNKQNNLRISTGIVFRFGK